MINNSLDCFHPGVGDAEICRFLLINIHIRYQRFIKALKVLIGMVDGINDLR